MFSIPTGQSDKQEIENLKLSDLTVAQFRLVMEECFSADRNGAADRELSRLQALGLREPGRTVW